MNGEGSDYSYLCDYYQFLCVSRFHLGDKKWIAATGSMDVIINFNRENDWRVVLGQHGSIGLN